MLFGVLTEPSPHTQYSIGVAVLVQFLVRKCPFFFPRLAYRHCYICIWTRHAYYNPRFNIYHDHLVRNSFIELLLAIHKNVDCSHWL